MKKAILFLLAITTITACKKSGQDFNIPASEQLVESQSLKPPAPPLASANPAFAFQDYFTQGNRRLPGLFVMDLSGANKTRVYASFTNQTHQTPDFPAWSADGSKLCFTLNNVDLYTLNISLVSGVPTGSGATKIGNGVAGGGSYKQGKWRPGFSQIASVWKKTGEPDKIHSIPSVGGGATVLYTAASTDWVVENDIAFKSDGSQLVFSERQVSTGIVLLKIFDIASAQIIKSIDMSQFKSIVEMDWARSMGSNIVAITTKPLCDNTQIGQTGIHQLFTVDVSSPSPSLTWHRNDVGNISWAPDDTRISVPAGLGRSCGGAGTCCTSSYSNIGIYTFATNSYSLPSYTQGNHHDWKR